MIACSTMCRASTELCRLDERFASALHFATNQGMPRHMFGTNRAYLHDHGGTASIRKPPSDDMIRTE
jgi:hypothetical protein